MKVVLIGIAAAVVLAAGAGFALQSQHRPAYEVYSTTSVRVGDPGQNLVGPAWSGEPGYELKKKS